MRMWTILAAAACVAACAGEPPAEDEARPAAATPPEPAAAALDGAAGFALIEDGDTVSVERFREAGGRLAGELRNAAGATIRYGATLDGGRVRTLELRSALPGGGGAPGEGATLTLEGDSVLVETRTADAAEYRRYPAGGAMPYVSPSLGLIEHALRAQAGTAAGPLALFVTGYTEAGAAGAAERLGADSVVVRLPADTLRLHIGPDGRIRGGRNARGSLTVARLDGGRQD